MKQDIPHADTPPDLPGGAVISFEADAGTVAEPDFQTDNPHDASADGVLYDKSRTVLIRWPPGKPGGVVIPSRVASIGDGAFAGNGLAEIVIPDSVISIGERAFEENRLTDLVIGRSVATIGKRAFAGNIHASNGRWKLILEMEYESARRISGHAGSLAEELFINSVMEEWKYGNNLLTHVAIPDSVVSIGEQAFAFNFLIGVTIGNGVTSIGYGAFCGNRLTEIAIPDGVVSIDWEAFAENQLAGVAVGGNVVSIGRKAFYGNELTEIVIPDGVASIESEAFAKNPLTDITIGKGLSSIGENAFGEHPGEFTVSGDNPHYASADGILYDKSLAVLIRCQKVKSGGVAIPSGVISIGDGAFAGNGLTEIVIPDGVISIGNRAFAGSGLTEVVIPDGVASIGYGAFLESKLAKVTIGVGVSSIGARAFSCNRLTEVVIPAGVVSIGKSAFAGNPLTRITIGANAERTVYDRILISFARAYLLGGRLAGTYARPDATSSEWTRI